MKETYKVFLQLLGASLYKKQVEIIKPNWQEILQLANSQKVLPLIYESACETQAFNSMDLRERNYLKTTSIQIIYSQIQRSDRFLQLYKEFNKAKIKALVFKGIILRELYPIPDERISGDEDLLIKKEDLKEVIEILEANNMIRVLSDEDEADVFHYF